MLNTLKLVPFTSDLDKLCTSGQFIWARLNAGSNKRQGPVKNTPIGLLSRANSNKWFSAFNKKLESPTLSSTAEKILGLLQQNGASFYFDLAQQSGILRTQVHDALSELSVAGLITSDNFTGLRALIAPNNRKPRHACFMKRGMLANSLDNAGRWSLLNAHIETKPDISWFSLPTETLEYIAHTLLQRYGVVFRKVLTREPHLPPWHELLYIYQRMEARGEIRGGRFVDSVGGEQFALPEAVGLLRKHRGDATELVTLSATDPLNLTGIILPGERIPAKFKTRIVFRNGIPAMLQSGNDIKFLTEMSNEETWEARTKLARKINPTGYTNRTNILVNSKSITAQQKGESND